jgi:hypothetical protein
MKVLGQTIPNAEGTPIAAAFAGDPGEVVPDPGEMRGARDLVLSLSGFEGQPALAGAAATQVVLVDIAGLYYDELFLDAAVGAHAQPFRALAQAGTSFDSAVWRYRSWAENEYEMLVGGAPGPLLAVSADADPEQVAPPGVGLLMLPAPPVGTPSNPAALSAWRASSPWATDSLLQTAHDDGMAVGVFGSPDFHLSHLALPPGATRSSDVSQLASFLGSNAYALALVCLGGKRTGDRHSSAALAELDALGQQLTSLRAAAPNALFIVTSRGASDIDDSAGDFYGPRSSEHVPLLVVGPNVRANVVTGQPATSADLPATALFGVGNSAQTDFVEGTWMVGSPGAGGLPQPRPAGAVAGHVLLRAFETR